MKRARVILLACAALLAVAPALAVSPPDQYDTFTRDEAVIHDAKTGLSWQRDNGAQMPWSAAKAYCDLLERPSGTATLNDFRLPTYKELLTLVDENPSFEEENGFFVAKAIDANAFPQTPATYFWSSTPNAAASALSPAAWRVNFGSGESNTEDEATPLYVRCVRP